MNNKLSGLLFQILSNSKEPLSLSQLSIESYLLSVRGAKFIDLVSVTNPFKNGMRKTGHPYRDNLLKFTKCNGQITFKYENAVNNRRVVENKIPDFKSKENYHSPIYRDDGTITALSVHKVSGKKYLRFRPLNYLSTTYVTLDGKIVPYEDVKNFIPDYKPNKSQNIEKEVEFRCFKLNSIAAIITDGKVIIPNEIFEDEI